MSGPGRRHLVFWGTADPAYLRPAEDWAGVFGTPSVTLLAPQPTTAFFGNADLTVATWALATDSAAFARQSPYSQWNVNGVERKFWFINDVAADAIEFAVWKAPSTHTVATGLGAMREGRWYRLVGCHSNGNEIRLYVNGRLVDSRPHTAGLESGDGARPQFPWLGDLSRGDTNYDVDAFWRGLIGPTSYYTRTWTPQEVAWDYNSGQGRAYDELGRPGTDGAALRNGLVAHWEMTEEDTGAGAYVVRRDASPGGHDLYTVYPGMRVRSAVGILPRTDAVAESDRVQRWVDRSPLGNDLTQSDNEQRPFWDAGAQVLSVEDGTWLSRSRLAGLAGRELSLYVTSIVKASTLREPWLRLRGPGGEALRLYRTQDRLVADAWIGGRRRQLSFGLSYPAERLIELHYGHGRLSLWENGTVRASTRAAGGFGQRLTSLRVGPDQGLSEVLIYDEAHQ
jgi:hypothetical protein